MLRDNPAQGERGVRTAPDLTRLPRMTACTVGVARARHPALRSHTQGRGAARHGRTHEKRDGIKPSETGVSKQLSTNSPPAVREARHLASDGELPMLRFPLERPCSDSIHRATRLRPHLISRPGRDTCPRARRARFQPRIPPARCRPAAGLALPVARAGPSRPRVASGRHKAHRHTGHRGTLISRARLAPLSGNFAAGVHQRGSAVTLIPETPG